MIVPVKFQVAVYDFVERVGSTAAEAGLAVYLTQQHPDIATVGAAALAAAAKYVALALHDWQVKHDVHSV